MSYFAFHSVAFIRVKLEEEQMSKIQRENHMLLEKISHIMRTTGRIDNKNDYHHKRLVRCGLRLLYFDKLGKTRKLTKHEQ